MGSLGSRVLRRKAGLPRGEAAAAGKGGKRKRGGAEGTGDSDSDGEAEREERLLHLRGRRKKLKSTSKYIYQTLFLNGENSDIKICALGEEWNLHKIYLCQSGYFSSMFSGSWKESSMNVIELEIPDQNIDVEALQVAFGSLYRDDVLINPSRVVALLAAACMLQLDGLIQQCGETMKETITAQTVCGYYNSAGTYGLDSVKKKCLEWLLNNLMTHQSVGLFKELSINLMKQLISSSNLFVLQVEMDVYTALKKWMFLQLVPSWNGSFKQVLSEADAWFAERRREWLSSVYKQQWFAMLRAEQDNDIGPQEINKEELEGNSMRCGRKLAKDGDYCWRWTGFNFGLDLLVTYTNRYIIFKRNTLNQPCSGSVSLQPRRSIAFRLRLASFDCSGKMICSRTTGYQILTLEKDQEQIVMNLDSRLLTFPLYICCNFLYTSPEKRADSEAQLDHLEC
ncbi:germ cell-less protein-like 1 isoform X2 [Melospiza georgiana]|uniref:germ cell-less protein-like 1 isoform X2 n=1 Tax=Melospiza georgiana TaxID=44398 RepID=UPI0025AC62B7|nr:germ cell-less protein-like 1 isoform X2 [Melospiza georgiana]